MEYLSRGIEDIMAGPFLIKGIDEEMQKEGWMDRSIKNGFGIVFKDIIRLINCYSKMSQKMNYKDLPLNTIYLKSALLAHKI